MIFLLGQFVYISVPCALLLLAVWPWSEFMSNWKDLSRTQSTLSNTGNYILILKWKLCETKFIENIAMVNVSSMHQFINAMCQPMRVLWVIEGVISVRRLLYLHEILSRNESELIHEVYIAMKEAPLKDDWYHLVRKDIDNLNLTDNQSQNCQNRSSKY